jgi:tetrahydrodipicolinate N-succinyltransferase
VGVSAGVSVGAETGAGVDVGSGALVGGTGPQAPSSNPTRVRNESRIRVLVFIGF